MADFKTEHLIAEVRRHPQLYRRDHEHYTDLESKQRAWREVAAAVFQEWPSFPRGETYELILLLQKKWRSLRDAFNRELRLQALGGARVRKKYIYYKQLKFLKGEPDHGQCASKESNSEDEDPLRPTRTRRKRPRRKSRLSIKDENQDELEDITTADFHHDYVEAIEDSPALPAGSEAERDSDRLFLLSYAEEMRRLPAHVRMWARAQISKVMQEAVAYCCDDHGGRGETCAVPSTSVLADVSSAIDTSQLYTPK